MHIIIIYVTCREHARIKAEESSVSFWAVLCQISDNIKFFFIASERWHFEQMKEEHEDIL